MANTDDDDVEESGDVPLPAGGVKKKILMYLIPAIVLVGIGVGAVAVFFTNVGDKEPQAYDVVKQKDSEGIESTTVFYSIPEITANLRTGSGVFETIRIKLNLELSSVEDINVINSMLPRINDIVLSHLVELTPEEVSGAEGFYALKTELLYRINLVSAPVVVSNLNIKDLSVKITDALDKRED